MGEKLLPEVNGCYLDIHQKMFKVRMLEYLDKKINRVIVEDTSGNFKSIDMENWQNLNPIPCCKSSNKIRQIS